MILMPEEHDQVNVHCRHLVNSWDSTVSMEYDLQLLLVES